MVYSEIDIIDEAMFSGDYFTDEEWSLEILNNPISWEDIEIRKYPLHKIKFTEIFDKEVFKYSNMREVFERIRHAFDETDEINPLFSS